jgi:hypothetical protein
MICGVNTFSDLTVETLAILSLEFDRFMRPLLEAVSIYFIFILSA